MHLLAKLLAMLAEPLVLLGLLAALAFLAARLGWRLAARAFALTALGVYLVIGFTPLPELMVRTLEDRFPPVAVDLDEIAGVIVLGGSTGSGVLAEERDTYLLGEAAERLTAGLGLAVARPSLPVLFSGYHGTLRAEGFSEGEMIRRVLRDLGFEPERFLFEERSRNTFENAVLSHALVGGDDQRPWLLVTSAFHMPRSVAAFRKAGFDVVPHPVDFRARLPAATWLEISPAGRFDLFRTASKEFLGLVAYRLLGRTDTIWPAPAP